MSRIVIFNTENRAEGEIIENLDRGWMLNGHPSVTGGGSTTLAISEAEALKSFLQFGRMVMVTHPKLPNWAGMIDTPWNALLPVTIAVYNAEYLLSLRCPELPVTINGTVGSIVAGMLDMFNAPGDMFIRIGDTSQADQTYRQEELDGRTYWDQLKGILQRSGCEMQTRAEKDGEGRLVIYLDIATRIGIDTGFLYFDGDNGNAVISDPILDGPIVNRVVGAGDQSGQESRLYTAPFTDNESGSLYRVRSQMVQFRGVVEQSTLDQSAQIYLENNASPRFSFLMNIVDKGEAFQHARLGNSALVRLTNIYLPGGVQGWKGKVRFVAMAYTESQNLLSVKAEAYE